VEVVLAQPATASAARGTEPSSQRRETERRGEIEVVFMPRTKPLLVHDQP